MVTLLLDSAHLEVVLSPAERALALRRASIEVPRSTISRVLLTADPWTWLRGIRAPGTQLGGVIALGTYRMPSGGRDFAIVRRHRPGVVVELDGHAEFHRLILTTRHGADLVTALGLDAGERARDVVDLATGAIDQVR